MLKKSKFRGISMANAIEVFLLNVCGRYCFVGRQLQKKINMLEKFCDKWGMEVNLTKTQVIVFRIRNGGNTSKSEKFTYESNMVKVVTYYRYLRSSFSSRNTWSN